MPLLLAVGMTEESASAFQQVNRSKIGKPSLLRINELLASNRTGKLDDERQSSDWVEIHNPGAGVLRLGGYHLTNDPGILDKWAFPINRIPAGGYHVVWISGRGRDGHLHELRFSTHGTIAISARPYRKPQAGCLDIWSPTSRLRR